MGSPFIGRQAHIGIHLEDDGLSGATATPDFWSKRMDTSFVDTPNTTLQNESDTGTSWRVNDEIVTGFHGEGDTGGKLWYEDLYYWLALYFGRRPTKTQLPGGAFKYEFELNNSNTPLSATIFSDNPVEKRAWPHAIMNSLQLTWTPDDYPKFTANFVSQKSVPSTHTAAFADDKDFLPKHVQLRLASDVAGLATANAAQLNSATIDLAKNATGESSLAFPDDYDPANFATGELEGTGSFERYYQDTTYTDMTANGTKQAMEFGFVDNDNSADADTPTSLLFTMPKNSLISTPSPWSLADKATETIDTNILFDLTAGKAISAVLITATEYTAPTP